MKIYTKTGDGGETSLYGCRVPKHHPVLEVIGALDELNASLGVVLAQLATDFLKTELTQVQSDIFTLGAEFATPPGKEVTGLKLLSAADVTKLEQAIDKFETQLPELKNFILPGGTLAAAELMRARAIARHAERAAVDLAQEQELRTEVRQYLNRLSDYLFVLSRLVNHQAGAAETIWQR